MADTVKPVNLANLIWQIADQLRGVYKPHQYGGVILPMTILRRLDCLMSPHRDVMRKLADATENPDLLARKIRKETGLAFYNTSPYDFPALLADPDGLRDNVLDYTARFSANIDVFPRFRFENEVATLAEKERLYLVVAKFAAVDLHPDHVPNAAMGDMFEELIRKFAEASNEEAGEHYTPRDAIRLMVDLLFAEDGEALTKHGVIRTVYDPTAGTGGMLTIAEDHLLVRNPTAVMRLYGQEINDQSYAICKSDMIAKGQDASNVQLGDTLSNDRFAGKTFDYCLSNPPYGSTGRLPRQRSRPSARPLARPVASALVSRGSVTARCCSCRISPRKCGQLATAVGGPGSSSTDPHCSTGARGRASPRSVVRS